MTGRENGLAELAPPRRTIDLPAAALPRSTSCAPSAPMSGTSRSGRRPLVDACLQTDAEGVFAAGDIAGAYHPLYGERIRVEHWANALNQGPAAARNMLGQSIPYERIPYFFSDQYDVGMEYSGFARGWDRVVFRGDPAAGEFIAFWMDGDRVLAGMNVNVWDVAESIQRLIRERIPVDDGRLEDASVAMPA